MPKALVLMILHCTCGKKNTVVLTLLEEFLILHVLFWESPTNFILFDKNSFPSFAYLVLKVMLFPVLLTVLIADIIITEL
jgi:hypothetical protein